MEQWRPVVGFERQYEVSDHGRVRRCARQLTRSTGAAYTVRERLLAQVQAGHRRGYLGVGFKVAPHTNRVFLVHRLVALAFVPNPRGLPEVNHKNLDKHDNRPVNLEWCSGSANQRHAAALGRFHGRTNPRARFKLQPDQVDAILQRAAGGELQYELAADYGVSTALVSLIVNRKVWLNPIESEMEGG